MIGQHLSEVVGAVAYSGYLLLAERVFAGEALRLEGWVEYPGRGLRCLRETFIPYGATDGEIEVVAVFGRDHTDLKLREHELAARLADLHTSEALKTAIVDHALAALVTTDAQGRIVEFNPAAEAIFGRARAARDGPRQSARRQVRGATGVARRCAAHPRGRRTLRAHRAHLPEHGAQQAFCTQPRGAE